MRLHQRSYARVRTHAHTFQVMSNDGTQPIGKITKQWSGLAKEIFTDADNFGIQSMLFSLAHFS